ncbi:MAG: helix-turn-helix domain-containing protein [Acutalibacteraceae bacterium]
MTVYFGENLKRLRKEKNITQETLADYLGVSFQAVSKWERGETYPDITMLPSLSAFFDVSVDDLLGIDKAKKEQKIREYLEIYDTMRLKDLSVTFQKFQRAVKEFPGEFRILIRYMELLTEEKDCISSPDYEKTSQELVSIYQAIQSHCTDDSIRIWSKRLLCRHLFKKYDCTMPHDEKYRAQGESIIREMPSLTDTREYLSMMFHRDTSTYYEVLRGTMEELLYLLQNAIISYCYYDESFTPAYKIEVISHMNGLFHRICSDGNYGKNRIHLVYNYGHLGHLYFESGDRENAIRYLRLCAEYARKCDELSDTSERAAWFYERENCFRDMSMCKRMRGLMTEHYPLSDDFKATPEFQKIISLLAD